MKRMLKLFYQELLGAGNLDAVLSPVDTTSSPLSGICMPPSAAWSVGYAKLSTSDGQLKKLVTQQGSRRNRKASHGLISLRELARAVAKNYREVDGETLTFVNEVSWCLKACGTASSEGRCIPTDHLDRETMAPKGRTNGWRRRAE